MNNSVLIFCVLSFYSHFVCLYSDWMLCLKVLLSEQIVSSLMDENTVASGVGIPSKTRVGSSCLKFITDDLYLKVRLTIRIA